jgi:hypothetical protein
MWCIAGSRPTNSFSPFVFQLTSTPILPAPRPCYVPGVDPNRLTPEQVAALERAVLRSLRYFGKLRKRMDSEGWPRDSIRSHVEKAYESTYALRVHLHYLACDIDKARRGSRDP